MQVKCSVVIKITQPGSDPEFHSSYPDYGEAINAASALVLSGEATEATVFAFGRGNSNQVDCLCVNRFSKD